MDETFWIYIDLWRLKSTTILDVFPQLRINYYIESLWEAKGPTEMDEIWGYWHLQIKKVDIERIVFNSHIGTYWYTRVPFALHNATASLQRKLVASPSTVQSNTWLIYVISFPLKMNTNKEKRSKKRWHFSLPDWSCKLQKVIFSNKIEYFGHLSCLVPCPRFKKLICNQNSSV